MNKRYALIRKVGKKQWQLIYMQDDDGSHKVGGSTTNLERAERERDVIQTAFPEEKYAIMEIGDF